MGSALSPTTVWFIWRVLEQPFPPGQERDYFIFVYVQFEDHSSCLGNKNILLCKNKQKNPSTTNKNYNPPLLTETIKQE